MRNRGFTLVELAIVLVIIGVILGGVIKGQELVTNSKIKRLYRDYQQLEFAYFTYYDRYNGIPGDMHADSDADINNLIEDSSSATSRDGTQTGNEDDIFWYEIRNEGLYSDGETDTSSGTHILGGNIIISNSLADLTGNVICFQNMTAKRSVIFDSQFDDGDGTTGKIRGSTATPDESSAEYSDDDSDIGSVCLQLD